MRKIMRDRRGVAAVEFALVAPVLTMLMLGGATIGIAIHDYDRLTFASESAARCGAIGQTCKTADETLAYAVNQAGLDGAEFAVTMNQQCGVRVGASYTVSILNLMPDIPLNVSSCYAVDGGGAGGPPMHVAQLPVTAADGAIHTVDDGNNPVFGQVPSGGGAARALVVFDALAQTWVYR